MILSDIYGFAPITWKGAWVAGTYPANSMVKYNGLIYVSKNTTSTTPTTAAQWDAVIAAAPSMTYFSESQSLSVAIAGSKTSSVITSKLTGEPDLHFVIYPKGIASIATTIPTVGQKPPFTDNVRGVLSVDLQTSLTSPSALTNGPLSFACHASNKAIGEGACAIGDTNNQAIGKSSSIISGPQSILSGECSSSIGKGSEDLGSNAALVHGSDPNSAGVSQGGYQHGKFILQAETVGGEVVTMAINPLIAYPNGTVQCPLNTSLMIIDVILLSNNNQVASWRYGCAISRSSMVTPGSTFFFNQLLTKTFDNTTFLSVGPPTISVGPDHNNGFVKVDVGTCEAGGRWLANVTILS
jgi:hypothetical protein